MKFIYNLQTDSGFQNPDVWLQLIAVIGVWLFGETNPPWLFGEINPDNRENAVGWFQVTISSIARFIATENVRNYIPAGPSQRIDSCSKNVLAQDGSEEGFICFTWKFWFHLLTVLYLWSASAGPLAMWRSGIPNCSQRCVSWTGRYKTPRFTGEVLWFREGITVAKYIYLHFKGGMNAWLITFHLSKPANCAGQVWRWRVLQRGFPMRCTAQKCQLT